MGSQIACEVATSSFSLKMLRNCPSIDYDEPWLVGFEYSREDPGFSENPRELEISKDIYRHPERWGQPTRRFDKSHDVYSLGIILLEIGLWKPASYLEDKRFRETDYTERV